MSGFSIRNPYFIVVVCLIVAVVGVTSLVRMPVDLFPTINIPEVVVATVVPKTSATFPSVDDMFIPLVTSAVNVCPTAPPLASLTSKYCPGAMVPVVKSTLFAKLKLPALDAYCTEYGVTEKSTVVVPRLNSSTKSF